MKIISPILIAILITIIVISFVLAGTENYEYSATVTGVSNLQFSNLTLTFSNCAPGGNCDPISESINVRNDGNDVPGSAIAANFTTNVSNGYGLNLSTTDIMSKSFNNRHN